MLYCSNMLAHGHCSHFSSSSTPRIWHLRYSSNFSPLPSEKSVFPPIPHLGKPLRKKSNPLPKTKTKASLVAQSCLTLCNPWTAARQASLSITNSQSLLKLMSIESVMPSSHLIFCCPLHLLPSIFPSIRVFCNESVLCIRWPKYWSFKFSR